MISNYWSEILKALDSDDVIVKNKDAIVVKEWKKIAKDMKKQKEFNILDLIPSLMIWRFLLNKEE